MLKLERPKLQKQQTDFVNASKLIIKRILYKDNNIPQSLKHYLDRAKIEDANQVTEEITKYSPIQTPLIINPETSQLEHQEYKPEDLEKHIHELDDFTHLVLLKRNRRSDSSDEDNQQLKNAKLFDVIRKKQSEKIIIEEIKRCLDDGAEINARNTRGKAVLHIAVEKNCKDVAEFLLKQQGININTPNKDGKTALNLAEDSNNHDMINIFTKYSVNQHSVGVVDSQQQGPSQLISAGTDRQVAGSTNLLSIQQSSLKRKATTNSDEEGIAKKGRPIIAQDLSQFDSTIDINTDNSRKRKVANNDNDIVSAKRQFLDQLEIPSEGSKLAQHGNIFQLKLLMLFLWRAKDNDYNAFRLATELPGAEKFDDVTFQYQQSNGDKWKFRLLQAKHKEGATAETELSKIKTTDLLSTDDNEAFSLQKYFRSYLKIKQRSKESSIYSVFSESEIEDIIVITNTDFDSDRLENNFEVDQEKDIEADELLKVGKDHNTKWQEALVYKLKDQENNAIVRKLKPIFKNTSDFYKLVEELAEHILMEKQIDKTGLFKDYYYPLIREVFKIEKKEGKSEYYLEFLPKFINEDALSKETIKFRNALIKEITFIQNNQDNKVTISEEFGKNELPSDDSKLKELAKKLTDCVEQKQELTVSNFEDYHVALATEVINPETKKFRSSFINPKKDANKKKLRDFFKTEIVKIRQIKKITNDQLKSIEFTVSRDFGESKLPNNDSKLKRLAETLANAIKNTEELKPSLSEEFKNYHVVLAKEVIDINTKQFQEIFIHGKVKEGNNIKQLSTLSKEFRRILLDKMVNADQVQSTKDSLKAKAIKVSEGFMQEFKPVNTHEIQDVQEFAKQIKELLSKSINEKKVVEINENSVAKDKFDIFAANIKKLAGYVLIEKFHKVRFSTSFLYSDELLGNLKNFRDQLKSLLGQEVFELIYEYEFDIKVKGFKTCEDGELYRKLPVVHSDSDVNDFFSKLKFVVNYPNRIGVNDLLEEEIKDKFKMLDSKAFNSLYQEDLHNWMADRVGVFYTVDKAKILFQQIENNLSLWTIDGFNKPYFANASKKYKFQKYTVLNKFLSDDIQQVLHLVFEDLALGRTRIVQTFEQLQKGDSANIQKYTRDFGYIFLYLDQLDDPNVRSKVYEVLKDSSKFNLIVIECNTQNKIEGLYNNLSQHKNSKKIIFITDQKNDALASEFAEEKERLVDGSSFNDLEAASQKKFLKEEAITFQGGEEKTSLEKLIEIKDLDNYLSQKENQDRLNNIMNSETLVKFIKNEEISIGHDLPISKGYNEDYYIPRKLNQQIILSKNKIHKDIKDRKIKSDFFVISGTDSELEGYNKIYVFDKNNDELAGSKFQELCEQNTGSNIHWLKSESGKIIWHQSEGSISNLVKYREIDKVDRTDDKISEKGLPKKKYLEKNTSKIVIIADTAGMGKSTVLTSFSVKIKEDNPSLWVIRIDLNDYTTVLSKELANRKSKKQGFSNQDINTAVNFLLNDLLESQKQSKLTTKLEQELFKNSFNGQGKIALLFDGFDEISPDYQDVVIDILQVLKNSKVEKLFVTTRPNMRELLEERLGVFSYVLEPFSKEDQIKFFTKFWTKKLELKDLNQEYKERLDTYAKSLIKKFSSSINDKVQTFIGIPLHTMMLAEIFQEKHEGTLEEWEGCKEFIDLDNTNEEPKLPEQFDLLDLYERFVKRKFYEFHLQEKKTRNFSKPDEKDLADENYKNFKKRHEILALHRLFSDEDVTKLLSQKEIQNLNIWLEDIKSAKKNEGIIDRIIDKKPNFIHRSFAEYFASFPLVKKMSLNSKIICTAVDSLVANASPVFISSIATILNKEKVRIESYTVLDFITRNKENYLKFFNALLDRNYQDDLGKTSLHYAVQHNYGDTIEYILNYKHDILEKDILKHGNFKKPEYENSNLVKFVNQKDNEGNTALDYADNSKLDTMLSFKLLLNGANIDGLTQKYLKKLIQYMLYTESSHNFGDRLSIFDGGILSAYANQDNKFRPIQEKLLLQAPNEVSALSEDYEYPRLLSYFFVHGRVKMIDTLLSSINDEEKQKRLLNATDNGATPLDRVNNSDQLSDDDRLEITKYLLEHGATEAKFDIGWSSYNTDSSNRYITKILQAAAQRGHIKTFEHFISQENHDYYYLHLSLAMQNQQLNIVKYFLENHRDNIKKDGNTALHSACDRGANLKIIKFLIDNEEDINAQNDKDETPLFMAIYANKLNIIEYLITRGANINAEDKTYNTPLSSAVEGDQVDIIKYLLKEGANISENASQLIRDKVAFFRDPSQFNLDIIDENGFPRLHAAIKSSNFEWVKFIVRQGADINNTDRQEKTPLHWASELQQTDIVELLLQYGAIFDKKDINNSTPRDLLSQQYNSNKIIWLLDILNELFSSQNLMQDLNKRLLENKSGRLKNGGPYGSGHRDAWDGDNPMLFILNVRNAEGKTLLHIAADTNDQQASHILLKFNRDYLGRRAESRKYPRYKDYQSTSIDAIDSQGNTPLHLAAQKGHNHMVSRLLAEGAIFNAKNSKGDIPEKLAKNNNHDNVVKLFQATKDLFIAIKENNILEAKNCINKKAYINSKDENGKTPLHVAASSEQIAIVQFLLHNDANIEAIDLNKNTPLHVAAEHDKTETVKLLLKYRAIYNAKNTQDQTPLDLASAHQSYNLLKQIDKLFNDIQSDNPQVSINDLEMIHKKYKIDISTIINTRDNQGNTLLHYTAELNYFNFVKLLLENGAIFNAQNKLNNTPENINNQDITNLLKSIEEMFNDVDNIKKQETVNIQKIITNVRNDQGMILLHQAAESGKLDIVQLLVGYGADVNAQDEESMTALHLAAQKGHADVVQLLLKHQADVNVKNKDEFTALHLAAQNGHKDVIQLLEEPKIKGLTTVQESEALESLSSASGSSCSDSSSSSFHSRKKRAIWSCSEREEESGKQQVVKVGKWHEVVRWLIEEKGADINAKDEFGRTILHKAAEFGRLDLVKWLLEERGADVNTLDKYDTSLLHFATASGNVALVKWLVEEKHLAINAQDKFGKSALHFAALYNYKDIVKLLVAKNADINLRDRNGKTALDLARKEQHQEMIKQLQKASIKLENKQYIEISLDNLTELRKEQKEIGLKPSGSASTFGCNTQYRTKRHIGSCQEEESNNVSYEPLEESVPVEQVRASRIYSQISMAVILKNADQFSSGNNALDHILTYNKYIGEIIAEQKANNSPREQKILASHYQQAQQFLKDYLETKLLKKIVGNSDEVVNIDDNQSWLFDNGQQIMLVFKEGNHYGLYSQDFNYRQKFQTREDLTFEQLEGFIKAFFKWHSGSSKYQTFTLADTLPAKLIKQLKLAKFWHAEQVAPDNILLHEQHLGLIESISALVIRKLFLLHGQSPDIAGLHADFFAHNKNDISLRFEMLHKVLPSLNAEQIQGLMAVTKKYNIAIDRTYLNTLSGDEKSLLELYYNKLTNKLKTDVTITPQLLSELSWESLSDGVANHPDISHELASKIVNSNKQVHEAASKGAVLKGMATQGLFFLPDIIRAANSGDISNLEQMGAMMAGDAAINHLYSALISKLATIMPAARAELLGKLPVTSPIFKALTIYSIVELHKQLANLPANSEERSIIKHKLGEQYVTAGLMVAELLGFEVTPLWIGLIAEQLIFDATSFRKQNHLDIPFWEALAMSLGFEQDKLQNILEERQLVEMNLALVNQINNQTQIPYGLTIVKIPKLGKLKWQNITQDQVPDNIRYKIDNIQDFSPVISPYQILEENGFRRVDKYELNAYQAYSETFLNRGKLISSIWQKASYDAYPQKSKLAFALHHNNMNSFTHEDNIFLDQLSVNNVTYQRIPSKATGIFLNGQDVLKRSEAEAAAVYLNAKAYHHANAQSNFYVGFDPREGDIELEFTSQGLERIDTMNVMRYFATKNIAMHNSLNNTSPYMITVQLANKPYPDSLEFAKDKGVFSVRDNSQRIISQYVINDNIDYIIKDFTSATRISFMSNLEQQAICNTIRSEPNTIFILKWQCNNKMVNGKNQIEYLNLTDISGRILISDNKKYLQLILNNHVIDSHLRVSAEHIDIIEAQGRLDKNSKIDIMQAVNSFNVTLRGDIIVSDQATYLQMQGEVASILPAIIYAKSAHNKVISLYEFNLDNLQPILETMFRSNNSGFMDIKFSSNDVQYHWHNKLPINNTLQLAGRLDGKRALLQIELKSDSLRVFNDDNSITTTQIAHYDANAILENGLILQKVFRTIEPNVTVTSNSELLTSTDSGNMLEFNIAGYYGQADVLEFQAPAGYFIYHYFPINRIIKLNNINYIVKNQMICASSAGQTIINGYELIKYGTISNLGNIEQMVGICFPHLLAESKIFVKNDTLRINDLTLKSLEDSTKLYFNETEILSVKTLKDSLAKNQISNVTASNTKHIGKQNIAEHAGQEYLVNLNNSSRTINYNQLNKATIILNNIKTGELKVTANNNDLLFVASSSNHTLRIKNWPSNEVNNSDNRIVTLKFEQLLPAIEIRAINKLKLSEIAKIQNLVSKAELSYAITNKLEQLDAKMINDLKYLLVSSHKVGLTGNNHCLGLKSSAEQQEFISSYGQHYSQEQLQKILNHDQIIKALTWLIAKDYNDLALQEPSKEKTELITAINKCYKEVISGKIIHRLLKHLEEGHAIAKMERFIEHHEQELKQKITAEFKASKVASSSFITEPITEVLDSEIPQHVRGRRAIDVQNEHDDEVENINDTIITSTATSMQSPMNNMINWLKTNIVGALLSNVLNPVNKINWFTAENVKSSSIGAKQTADSSTNNTDKNSTSIKSVDYAQFNLNDSLTLADLIIRKITKVKPYITKEAPLNLLEAQAQVLNIIAGFEEILEEYAKEKDILMAELKFDPITLQKQLISEIVNGSYSNIAKILSASLEKTQAIKDTKLKHYLQDKITAILEKQQDMLLANEPLIDNKQNNQFSNQPKIENIDIVYNIADVENYGNITTNCQPDIGLIG